MMLFYAVWGSARAKKIEDEDVHATLKILFEMLWKAAETPHNEFLKQIKKPSKK